jgi:prepilin-type N-terminal cleavage/methylation domain-containing protein
MKRNRNRSRGKQRAFTLIELLVVIAIIAILAAILFPVFAQAKAAAKAAVSVSNMKQNSLGMIMYASDNDDMNVRAVGMENTFDSAGNYVSTHNELSWKHMIMPYVKNVDLYKDPANTAAKFPDFRSDPAARALRGWPALPANMRFNRGYVIANIWTGSGFMEYNSFSTTTLSQPATTFNVVEAKVYDERMGPFQRWVQDVDAATGITPRPATGLQWTRGTDKWSNKAMVVGFHDGHAKRMAFSEECGKNFMSKPDGSSDPDFWNLTAAQKAGWSWIHNDGCGTLPAQFR